MSDHEDETITAKNAPPKNVPQITTVTNISAKFPYLKKGEYDIWAMKMQNFISSFGLLCWNIVLKGNSAKSMTIDQDGNLKIRPVTIEEHQQNAIKARFGGNAESKKMQKSILKQRVSVSAGDVAAAAVSPQSEIEFAFMGLSTEDKWNNSGKNLYKLIDSSMFVRTKRGLGLDKYIGEGGLGIDDSKVSIFHTTSDDLEGQPIYNSYLHLIKDCDLHEQRFTKRNAEGNGILGRRPTRKPVNQNSPKPVSAGRPKPIFAGRPKPISAGCPKPVSAGRSKLVFAGRPKPVSAGRPKPVSVGRPNPVSASRPNPVSADQPKPVSAGQPNTVFAGDGILGPRPLNF
nr:ribonuclease H-like domain-containing protein [Tanacetum cinerariifolium]